MMSDCSKIPLESTPVSTLIKDYLSQKSEVKLAYHRFPNQENYIHQAKEKLAQYSNRTVLSEVLSKQMQSLDLSEKQKIHLDKILQENTVTVTTGHQLNLLTGPLYFIYKILHTVKICDTLNTQQNEVHFVPIYWMATEDHDWGEVNHFYANGQKHQWAKENEGAVGEINPEGVQTVFDTFLENLPENDQKTIQNWLNNSYYQAKNWAEATRNLVQILLGKYGVLILDGDDKRLKKIFSPIAQKELLDSGLKTEVEKTNQQLNAYKNQAYAREINLFYLTDEGRFRIEKKKNNYSIIGTAKVFTEEEIITELNNFPERFSPNVLFRPFYQELILPNVAYIGGGGEIAYWLQLKSFFDCQKLIFPMLVVRNSGLLIDENQLRRMSKLNWSVEEIFTPVRTLIEKRVTQSNPLITQLEAQQNQLEAQFDTLEKIAMQTNAVFGQMLAAQRAKQLNGMEKLKKRLIKAESLQQLEWTERLNNLYDELFPNEYWQERHENFSVYYLKTNGLLFDKIYHCFLPFKSEFNLIKIKKY